VVFRSTLVGCYHGTLAFEFRPDPSSVAFHIVRYLEVDRGTPMSRELAPVSVFMMRPVSALPAPDFCRVVDGQPPDRYGGPRRGVPQEQQQQQPEPKCLGLIDLSISFLLNVSRTQSVFDAPENGGGAEEVQRSAVHDAARRCAEQPRLAEGSEVRFVFRHTV